MPQDELNNRNDLSDLVDYPRETLDIELKEWVDLSNKIAQAKIARHIAALANYGGGYIVFGFSDDGNITPTRPSDLSQYNRDVFNAIIQRYLVPMFHCEVLMIESTGRLSYPVIHVPSHGSTPICTKADGPHDAKGQPQGIRSGCYYVRKPGPRSELARGPEDWQPLIRRCVTVDRDSLLSDIARAVQRSSEPPPAALDDRLAAWHNDSKARWLHALAGANIQWPVALESNHCQLSYSVQLPNDNKILPREIIQSLESVNREVRMTVWTGWSMFYPFMRPEIAAALHPEFEDGTGSDVVESNLLVERDVRNGLPDYWRFSADGRATILRPYREDRPRSVDHTGRPAGTWLSPETVIRETAELVTHSRLIAERYSGIRISFRCTWCGLSKREIDDFDGYYWSPGRRAQAEQRTVSGTWDLPALTANWHEIVAKLSSPILGLFGFHDCNAQLVARMAPRFVKI